MLGGGISLAAPGGTTVIPAARGLSRLIDEGEDGTRLFGGFALREIYEIDRRQPPLHEVGDRLVQRRLAIFEVERHGGL